MFRTFRLTIAFILLGVVCFAQGQSTGAKTKRAEPRIQPYTAEFKTTKVQTLADGTTITWEATEIWARDWQGREMESTAQLTPNEATRFPETTVHVHDPVENTRSDWYSSTMTGSVVKFPPPEQRYGCWASVTGDRHMKYPDGVTQTAPVQGTPPARKSGAVARSSGPRDEGEDLGTQNILGVEARGHRETRTIPTGQIGNDRPIVTVREAWYALNLDHLLLRRIEDDPRDGKRTKEVVRLDLTDPDPALFEPPADYRIKIVELRQVPCDR